MYRCIKIIMMAPLPQAILLLSFGCVLAASQTPKPTFIRRQGATLFKGNESARFGGCNMYWLGLDENENGVAYPTKYRIDDALQTAAGMGIKLIRAHTLGISTGNKLSFEPSLGVFNDSALDAADYALYRANLLSLSLLLPLTDNYQYYHGGYHDFTDWLGLPKSDFFTNPQAIAAWQDYIKHRLTHVNPYTGKMAMDDPAILAWETGNELQQPYPPSAWTLATAAYIKSIDKNHLVMDGRYGIDPGTLSSQDVDLHSDHFYPVDQAKLRTGAAQCAAANKPYFAGEFGWTSGDVAGWLAAAQANHNVTATAWWSFFPHADGHGFVQHNDGFTVHFPGDNTAMQTAVKQFVAHTAAMAGVPVAPYPPPAIPTIIAASSSQGTLTWQGAALAASYSVDVSTSGANGPWSTVCNKCANDNQTPYKVAGGLKSGSYVRLNATNPEGVSSAYSPAWLVQ